MAQAAHSGDRHTGGHQPTGCSRFARDPAEQAAEQMLAAASSNPIHDLATVYALSSPARKALHASDAGACPRSIWYRINPPPGFVPAPTTEDEATLGSALHAEIAAARAHLYPWREYEQPVTIPGIAEEPSRIDQYDEPLGRITDCKSCGSWKWDMVEAQPWRGDVDQLLAYGYAKTCEGKLVAELELEYIHRETGQVRRYLIPYDHAAASAVVGRLRAMAAALDAGLELPRGEDYTGPATNGICRERCRGRLHCWNVEAAEAAGRSPESYTICGADPAAPANQPITAWALARYREVDDARKATRRDYDRFRELLRGIPDGHYRAADGTVWSYTDASRPSRNTTRWQAAISRVWLDWLESPDRDPAVLVERLLRVRVGRKYEFRPTVTPVAPAAPRPIAVLVKVPAA
ncbi:hypothetical protein [Nonomuraea sp. NPDC023979]|uniref:hypothetical protein n=1 Tax=Nonomuraea sp. NPDC023979 TaxID=3154796 RepID=UPI0033DDD103